MDDEELRELELELETGGMAECACHAALDVNNYILGRKTDLFYVKRIKEFIRDNLLGRNYVKKIKKFLKELGRELERSPVEFEYNPMTVILFINAIERNSDKPKRSTIPDYALEFRLLYNELEDIESLPKHRLESLRRFFIDLSTEYSSQEKSVLEMSLV